MQPMFRNAQILALAVMVGLIATPNDLSAQEPVEAVGPSQTVNAHTTGRQEYPSVVSLAGKYAVAWSSPDGADGQGPGVFLRFVSSQDGLPMGTDIRVSEPGASATTWTDVGALPDGGLLVIWQEDRGLEQRLMAAFVSSGGSPSVPLVLSDRAGASSHPRLAIRDDGSFVVVWLPTAGTPSLRLAGALFSPQGVELQSLFDESFGAFSTMRAWHPAFLPDGSILVAVSSLFEVDDFDVFLYAFDSQGDPQDPFRRVVATSLSRAYDCSRLVVSPDGSFWVVFTGGFSGGTFARQYDADLQSTHFLSYPTVGDGDCVFAARGGASDVALVSTNSFDDSTHWGQLSNNGTITTESILSDQIADNSRIARGTQGTNWLVVWEEENGDDDSRGIRSQLLGAPGLPLVEVPAMSPWGLLGMALLLGLAAYGLLRRSAVAE